MIDLDDEPESLQDFFVVSRSGFVIENTGRQGVRLRQKKCIKEGKVFRVGFFLKGGKRW